MKSNSYIEEKIKNYKSITPSSEGFCDSIIFASGVISQ